MRKTGFPGHGVTSANAHSEAVFESELAAHLFCRLVQSFVDCSMPLTFSKQHLEQ